MTETKTMYIIQTQMRKGPWKLEPAPLLRVTASFLCRKPVFQEPRKNKEATERRRNFLSLRPRCDVSCLSRAGFVPLIPGQAKVIRLSSGQTECCKQRNTHEMCTLGQYDIETAIRIPNPKQNVQVSRDGHMFPMTGLRMPCCCPVCGLRSANVSLL